MLGHEDYKALRRLRELKGPGAAARFVANLLESKEAKPEDFRIGPLFFATYDHAAELREEYATGGFSDSTNRRLMREQIRASEAGEVMAGDFATITGQIVFSKTREQFDHEEFIFSKEVDTMSSSFLGLEKLGMIGRVGDDVTTIEEGGLVPNTGPTQDYIEAPPAQKRGQKVALTWEAVFADRTGQLLQAAADVGFGLGSNKEKRVIDAIVDENAGAKSAALGGHRYHWFGTSYATFQTSTPWDNVTATNTLDDWGAIDAAEQTFNAITDPHTGEPLTIIPDSIVVTKQLEKTAQYIIRSTSIRVAVGGFPTNATASQQYSPNLINPYKILSSRLLATRMATDTTWFLGNLKRAVCYKEIRPLRVEAAPAGHPDEFDREIVNQWKATEYGNVFVQEPRAIVQNTVA